jgi:hypothetical protein
MATSNEEIFMSNFGFDEDNIVNKYLQLQRSTYLSTADKERLEQFMDSYHQSKMDFIKQLHIINEIDVTKRLEAAEIDLARIMMAEAQ